MVMGSSCGRKGYTGWDMPVGAVFRKMSALLLLSLHVLAQQLIDPSVVAASLEITHRSQEVNFPAATALHRA
ncbi:hypothetical protein B8W72_13560 [Pseudomonas putida]|uniref:Uncharacterized protein n=1 Tax=Pseudomonas putida TaxID=303 RepID=A0A1Y3LC22_PSEPU|nr:hypothetical protein B8W72_13560 [Pseudomonas putida]